MESQDDKMFLLRRKFDFDTQRSHAPQVRREWEMEPKQGVLRVNANFQANKAFYITGKDKYLPFL